MSSRIKITSGQMGDTPIIGIEAAPLLTAFQEVPGAPCDQPVILHYEGQQFVAVFDDEDKLRQQMDLAQAGEIKVKVIDDLEDFLASIIENGIRVMFNPYPHEGNMRWTEFSTGDWTDEQLANREQRIQSENYEKWKNQT